MGLLVFATPLRNQTNQISEQLKQIKNNKVLRLCPTGIRSGIFSIFFSGVVALIKNLLNIFRMKQFDMTARAAD